tara:strand:- start:59 stop:1864 length:1806 start_codon:yes stop_codon:yes gene_type:complete
MANTESLIVVLDAKTQALDAKLQSTNEKLDKLSGSTEKADGKFKQFTEGAKKAALATAAVAASVAALVTQTVQYAKELQIASKGNRETIEKMQGLAFAYNTVGISLEKLGGIGKDTNEKIGEFIADGTGGFSDFATVMGLTSIEAKAMAKEFEGMSGTDVLQEMVKQMEAGGASAKEMSWALEGMASDTTDLIPLLVDGSKALKNLTDDFDAMGVALSQEDINKITAVGIEFDKMTAKLGGETKKAVADYAEEIATAIRVTTEFLTTTTNVLNVIGAGWGSLLKVSQAAVTDMVNGTDTLSAVLAERAVISQEAIDKLGNDVAAGVAHINENMVVIGVDEDSSGEGLVSDDDEEDSPVIKKINREVEAIKDRFKTEQELLEKKFEEENALFDVEIENIIERDALKLELLSEFEANSAKIKADARQKELDAKDKEEAKRKKEQNKLDKDKEKLAKTEDKNAKDNAKRDGQFADDAMALANLVFADNKAVSAGIALVNTGEGITAALAKQNYAGAALTAAIGAAQISSILGASKGGGSVSSVTAVAPTTQQSDFEQDSTGLDFTDSDASGSTTNTITFSTDTGDELVDAIANALNKGQKEGRF